MRVLFGTHKTVVVSGGRRHTVRHNPPRDYREVLREYGRLISTRAGRLQPRKPFFDGVGDGKPVDQTAELTGTFVDARGRTRPITGLVGASIVSIISGEPFGDISAFAVALYLEAYEALKAEKRIGSEVTGGFDQLEVLFAAKVREILPDFRLRFKGRVVQDDIDLVRHVAGDDEARDLQLVPDLDVNVAGNVLDAPLLRVASTDSTAVPAPTDAPQAKVAGAKRVSRKRHPDANGLGCFTDFRTKLRSVPRLHAQTLVGIASQDGVLDPQRVFEADDFTRIGKAASDNRRKTGVGGGDCCAESVEFVIRVFRALGLTADILARSGAEAIYGSYITYVQAKRQPAQVS